jgi:hypothetical protein
MSTELVICKAMRHRVNGELSAWNLPVYIYGDVNNSSINRIELNASVAFNWAGGAQVFQARSTSLARLTATLTLDKSSTLGSGMNAETMGSIIALIRAGVQNHWQERQQTAGTGGLRRWYDLFTPDGSVTGVTSLPKQTQHEQAEAMEGEAPVFVVVMEWIFYIWTN